MLGSSRVVTTNTGVVCYDADFYPYGGERTVTDNCPSSNKYKFEGKERDDESGNDDFGARYYSWRFGRWLSADWSAVPAPVPYANFTNPQTLNLYAMVADDPETFADLDGHISQEAVCPAFESCASPAIQNRIDNEKTAAAQTAQDAAQQAQKQVTPQSLAAQVPAQVKAAIKASVDASNDPSAAAGDKTGGFHEEGGIWGTDTSGKAVPIPALPGQAADPRVEGGHIDETNSANPSLKNNLVSIQGKWHVHSSGSITDEKGIHSFTQGPSGMDFGNATFPINIVVGAGNKKVYFYNSSGVIGKPMKLKDFLGQ